MRKMKRHSAAAAAMAMAAVLTAALLLSACGGDSRADGGRGEDATGKAGGDGPVALAVVAGNHASAQLPDYSAAEDWMEETVLRGGSIRIIVSDGSPYGITAEIDNSVFEKSLTDSTRRRVLDENVTALKDAASGLSPQTEEVDTLQAVREAALFLSQQRAETKGLVILDTGLDTAGLLNFASRPELLQAAPEDVASALKEKSGLPDLTGVEVQMILSQTAAPQQELSSKERANLKAIWEEILQAAGASSVTVTESVSAGNANNAGNSGNAGAAGNSGDAGNSGSGAASDLWPAVSLVETAGDTAVKVDLRQKAQVFTEEKLGFAPDSDRLLDEAQARTALEPVAQYMKENPERTVIIMGSTASSGDEEFCKELSKKRAEKVASILAELGADRSRMQILGLGCSDPWHAEDLDQRGNLIESAARQNRKVMIMDAESSEAAKL